MKIHESPQITRDLGVFGRSSEEASVRCGLHDVEFGRDIGSAQRPMNPNGVGEEEIACSGRQEGGRKAFGELAKEWGEVGIGEVVAAAYSKLAGMRLAVNTVSRPRFVRKDSPDSVRSTSGVCRMAAAGSGRPSSRARRINAAARLPPPMLRPR